MIDGTNMKLRPHSYHQRKCRRSLIRFDTLLALTTAFRFWVLFWLWWAINSVIKGACCVNHPSILLADEPTGALDSKTSIEIMHLFEKLHEGGNTIIVVTHEHDIAERAHRVITIMDGRIETDERIR